MKKNYAYLVALASLAIATSCSEEELQSGGAISNNSIAVHPTIGKVDSRATETTTANLASFKTFSFLSGDDKNYMDGVTYNGNGGEWTSQDGTFYWPVTGDLNFYSYAPAQPGSEGTVSITPSAQKLTGFVPYATAATQQDFIYSKAKGNLADNGSTGVDLNFDHALSEISVQAQNSNTAYTVEVSGVKVGNVISKGDFTFPSLSGDNAAWSLGTEKSDYTTEWESATTLTSIYSSLDAANTAFMLLPQQLVAETKASDGSYIALKVKITMQGGKVIHDGWAYVAVPTLWEMGKHYNYTVDFSSGAGQDEDGNDIISGTNVKYNVTVTEWNEKDETPLISSIILWDSNDKSRDLLVFGKKRKSLYSDRNIMNISNEELKNCANMFQDNENVVDLHLYVFFNTSYTTNMSGMFKNCASLVEITGTRDWNTSKVTDMSSMFYDCTKLTNLDLSGWNTSNVTHMNCMFYGCKSLTSVYSENFDTQNVTDMAGMFCACNSLTSFNSREWDTSNVTDMQKMFSGCSALKDFDERGFKTQNVTNMDAMFCNCSSLTELSLRYWNTSKVTNMADMFNGCSSLETLYIEGWNLNNVTDMSSMFENCKSLKKIVMWHCDEATINKIKSALTAAGLSTDIINT